MTVDMMINNIEVLLITMQHLAAALFLIGGFKAIIYAFSLPKGPMRSMFTKLGTGFLLFAAMGFNWVVEDMYLMGDTIADVLFMVALIVSLWGFLNAFEMKLDVVR